MAVSFIVAMCWVVAGALAHPAGAQEPALPPAPPDAGAGLTIYAGRCANCHGPQGNGDGELAVNLPMPPRAFTDPAFRQAAVPASFYGLILNGNLDAGMPPFGPSSSNPLSEAEIWDAIAAVLALATPPEVIAQGQAVYEANCLACHGATGLGDGPDAAAAGSPVPDLTDLSYWFNRSNDVVFANLAPGQVAAHTYTLDDESVRAAVDYSRTFSYAYVDAAALNAAQTAPLPVGTITGQVINATTDGVVSGGTVQLRAFTPDIQESLSMTGTVDAEGGFQFEVTDVPPDWVYLVTVPYQGLSFSSDVGRLSQSAPTMELPVTVYDQTTDPGVVSLAQMHFVLEFLSAEQLQVTELYVFNNGANAVFVGESGDADAGVVALDVPEGATGVTFQRAFAAMDSFVPAPEVIQTAAGYADTVPLRPGRSNASLIVTYMLPYDDGAVISHQLPYPVTNATAVLPDVGVRVEDPAWAAGVQETANGSFLSYSRQDVPAGERLSLTLAGAVTGVAPAAAAAAGRNQTIELIVGGVALVAVAGAAALVVRARRGAVHLEDEYDMLEEDALAAPAAASGGAPDADGAAAEIDALVQQIADLDDAYERGDVPEAAYREERAVLKAALEAVWP